ncbi:S8 family serine peptidase [Aquibacillus salsiterrae]|uniref:S8 family serine peptidase n=1 Tax=Aquibacillus salsiterrae TaxID=2950439 RepID=A0A9X4ADU8_9BACI|nr:S8 family serine peptidase [Aquibacillus salsiterrae]MDC3415972.1 S8 family serine peptidase [Aquibacillus salsiterrae]
MGTQTNRLTAIIITILLIFSIPTFVFADNYSMPLHKEDRKDLSPKLSNEGKTKSIMTGDSINLDEVNRRRILVKLAKGASVDFQQFGLNQEETSDSLVKRGYQVVSVPEGINFSKALSVLSGTNSITFAEPDYNRNMKFVPSDPNYNKQWYLNKLNMTKAWDVTKGSSDVTIAILDTGVDASHPDLQGRLLPGYDFVEDDNDPNDEHGHGTQVAGVIAANSNQIGITGIDFKAKILPVKVANKEGKAAISDVVDGIYYAIDQGADVINMSYGTYEFSSSENEALWEAYDAGIVLVAAAGNDDTTELSYPAAYTPVISVGAINKVNEPTIFSNYGPTTDVAAPGENILSTYLDESYAYDSGTSFSAPMVSGLAGLLIAEHPTWTPAQIEWVLEASASHNEQSEWVEKGGYGVVNGYKALMMTNLPSLDTDAPDVEESAIAIRLNQTREEKIELPMDVDWVKFKVEKEGQGTISVTNVASQLDLIGELYQYEDGKQVKSYEIDEHDMGEDESLTMNFQPGTYYLAIYDVYNHWATQAYRLKVAFEGIGIYPDVLSYRKEIEFLSDKGIIHGFPDGTFKPTENVTRLQAVQMILNQMGINIEDEVVRDPGFTDIQEGMYGYKAVAKAVELGFITGREDSTFDPTGELTRAQMAVIMAKAFELEGSGTAAFEDVPADHWAFEEIDALAYNGIAKGYPDATFKPNEKISREHFSIFMYKYLTNL